MDILVHTMYARMFYKWETSKKPVYFCALIKEKKC